MQHDGIMQTNDLYISKGGVIMGKQVTIHQLRKFVKSHSSYILDLDDPLSSVSSGIIFEKMIVPQTITPMVILKNSEGFFSIRDIKEIEICKAGEEVFVLLECINIFTEAPTQIRIWCE